MLGEPTSFDYFLAPNNGRPNKFPCLQFPCLTFLKRSFVSRPSPGRSKEPHDSPRTPRRTLAHAQDWQGNVVAKEFFNEQPSPREITFVTLIKLTSQLERVSLPNASGCVPTRPRWARKRRLALVQSQGNWGLHQPTSGLTST